MGDYEENRWQGLEKLSEKCHPKRVAAPKGLNVNSPSSLDTSL